MKKRIPNSYSAFPSSVNMRYGKRMSNGGPMMNQLTEFNEGGRHEENGLGGIPQGMNPEGQMNLVEEGETKFNAENYIFSDTLKVDKELAKAFNLSPKMVGKTFADASKMAGRKNSRREGDKIEEAANNADLMNLMEAQEAFKQKEIQEKLAEIDALDPNVLPAMMGQAQDPNMMQDPAMGGQMQEASMMDQEAMMAQQGKPSPEEMAMMQNEMMGQQEGMMRSGGKMPKSVLLSRAKSHMSDAAAQEYVKNYGGGGSLYNTMYGSGGKLPKEILKARVKSHMSPAQADAYVENYGSGGYMKRSYAPGGFMGMNMANSNTFTDPCPCGTPGCSPCPGKETEFSKIKIGRKVQPDDGLTDLQKVALEISPGEYKPTLSIEEKAAKKAQEEAIDLAMDAPVGTNLKYTYLTEGNVQPFSDPRFKGVEVGIPMDTGYMNTNKLARKVSRNPTEFFYKAGDLSDPDAVARAEALNQARINKYSINDSNLIANRAGGKLCYGCGGKMHAYGGRMDGRPYATGGEIVTGIGSGLYGLGEGLLDTLTFGLTDELTDRGYDALQEIGPMKGEDNVGDAIRGGANAVGAAGGAVLSGGANTSAAIQQGSKGTGDMLGAIGEETGNENLGKIGKGIEVGGQVVGMVTGNAAGSAAKGAGTAASTAGDVTSTAGDITSTASDLGGIGFKGADVLSATSGASSSAGDAAQFGSKIGEVAGKVGSSQLGQIGMNTATQTLSNFDAKKEEERLAEEERKRIAREKMMTNDPNSPYYDPLGGYFMRAGGMLKRADGSYSKRGLWDNIRANIGSGKEPTKEMRKQERKINASSNALGGRLYTNGGGLTLKKSVTTPDGNTIEQDVTYNSLEELLADTEMVNKYGGVEATRQAFAGRFKKTSSIPSIITNPIETISNQVLNPKEEEDSPMISYMNQLANKEQEVEQPIQQSVASSSNNYIPTTFSLPIMPPGLVTSPPKNTELRLGPSEENVLNDESITFQDTPKVTTEPEKKDDTKKDDNEVDVNVNQKDINRDYTFKETPGQFLAKMSAPMMNLYSGIFDKYSSEFEPEYKPVEAPKLDYTESINAIRRSTAGLKRDLKKYSRNPGNLLQASQRGAQLEAQAIQQIDTINAKLEFEADKLNNSQIQRLEKIKKELQLGFQEAKRKSLQEAAKQFQEIATTNQANQLAQQYAAMGAENIGKVEYQTLVEQLGELLKNRREEKKKKKKKQ